MFKVFLFILMLFSSIRLTERENIIKVLENYNKAFGDANYSEIIKYFDYPTSFNLGEKTITARTRFTLKLIYKKIRKDLPDYYSYSKWNKIKIELTDDNIAIVNADFSRYKDDDSIYYSGSAQYYLRYEKGKWKIFSLTPYNSIKILD